MEESPKSNVQLGDDKEVEVMGKGTTAVKNKQGMEKIYMMCHMFQE
jgi:hypothetical protein